MAVSKCPQCHLPVTESEAATGTCPVCGVPFPPVEVPRASQAKDDLAAAKSNWSALLLAALLLMMGLAALLLWHDLNRELDGEELPQALAAKDAAEQAVQDLLVQLRATEEKTTAALEQARTESARAASSAATAEEKRVASEKAVQDALTRLRLAQEQASAADKALAEEKERTRKALNRPASEAPPDRKPNLRPMLPVPAPPVRDLPPPGDFLVIHMDRPRGEYTQLPLNNAEKIKLVGKVKTLKVRGVHNRCVLDASELRAEVILITEGINNASTVKLHAPGGVVMLPAINGQSQVEVSAPGGRVIVTSPITSASRLTVVAKEAEFRGAITGAATQALVTLTRGGRLRFMELHGGTRLHWKTEQATDPPPQIEKGRVNPGAELRQLE